MVKISDRIVKETVPIPTINIISINPPPPVPEVTYRTILIAGGAIQIGNTDSIEGHFSTFIVVKLKRPKFQVYAEYNYVEVNKEISIRNASSNLHYSFFFKDKIYFYAQTLF
jgi:hypothetical protein